MEDAQVAQQLVQMRNFILEEAEAKAAEIKAKAHEEFAIDKARIEQAEKLRIKDDFAKKEKQIDSQKKIAASNELNAARLRVLKTRDDVLQKVLQDAQQRLALLGKPGEQYTSLLKNLIVQGLIRINEAKVSVVGRKEDHEAIQSVLHEAAAEYKLKINHNVDLSLDTVNVLPPGPSGGKGAFCSGGVILVAQEGKIICRNTLDARLGLAYEQRLPEIRTQLFGQSASRKHFD
eukprot:TRINITY_DN203_c0_g1_i1.p1 TRINITY_DN203_c0_g1~~TRINITY_DN203_c0_g1_i1.p1  ORF type:complete len:233 (+),score=100.21 TRINITY_DN203_c0_g1_i1:128-826(+)